MSACTPPVFNTYCGTCKVAYTPDSSVWYFGVTPSLPSRSEGIALTASYASNVGAELLSPPSTVYVPARGCHPPLIISYGGAFVNECNTFQVWSRFYSTLLTPWCFSPSYTTHILRLDTLEWTPVDVPGGPPANLSNSSEFTLYSLGTVVAYDERRDALVLSGTRDAMPWYSQVRATRCLGSLRYG